MYTPFAYAFAYAIKQTPYAFVAKIILCMYLLYAQGPRKLFRSAGAEFFIRDACNYVKCVEYIIIHLYCEIKPYSKKLWGG